MKKSIIKYLVTWIILAMLASGCEITINEYYNQYEVITDKLRTANDSILNLTGDSTAVPQKEKDPGSTCVSQFKSFESSKCFLRKFKSYPDNYALVIMDSLLAVGEVLPDEPTFDREVYFSDNTFKDNFNSVVVYTALENDCGNIFTMYNIEKNGCIIDQLEIGIECFREGYYEETSSVITNDSLIEVVNKKIIANPESKDPFAKRLATRTRSFYYITKEGKFRLIDSSLDKEEGEENSFDQYFL
ncbi:MAG: hypothetical protein IH948_02805 [Bacteroidetes bacterium]|nr:hypothetical protein [Bacteroidota bacterium]